MTNDQISRRKFVKESTLAAVGIATAMGAAEATCKPPSQAKIKTRSYNENMEYRRLGKTELMISVLSLGGHWKKIPHQYGTEAFKKNRREVISACIDHGINYVDACNEHEILTYSEALRGRRDKMYFGWSYWEHEVRRKEWQTTEKLLEGLDDLMSRSKMDYIDFWRINAYWLPHKNHTPEHEEAMTRALAKAHQAGKVRFKGISTHKYAWTVRMIERFPDQIQAVVVPYTAGSKLAHAHVEQAKSETGWKAVVEDAVPKKDSILSLIDAVKKHDVGWLGIKPFASGSVFKSRGAINSATKEEDDRRARMTLRYVFCNDVLTAAIPGLISVDQVKNAAGAVRERREFDVAEARHFQQTVEEMWSNLPASYRWLKDEWEYV